MVAIFYPKQGLALSPWMVNICLYLPTPNPPRIPLHRCTLCPHYFLTYLPQAPKPFIPNLACSYYLPYFPYPLLSVNLTWSYLSPTRILPNLLDNNLAQKFHQAISRRGSIRTCLCEAYRQILDWTLDPNLMPKTSRNLCSIHPHAFLPHSLVYAHLYCNTSVLCLW